MYCSNKQYMNNAFKYILKRKYVIKTKYNLNYDDVIMHLNFCNDENILNYSI